MKKAFRKLLLFIFLLIPCLAQAQFVDYGVKFGVQSVGIQGDNHYNEPGRTLGMNLYGFAEWKINSWASTDLSLGYSMRGFSDTFYATGPDSPEIIQTAEARSQLHYLSAVYLVKTNMSVNGFQIFGGFGPRVEYLFAKKAGTYHLNDIYINNGYTDITIKDETAEHFDNMVYGLSFVIGAKDFSIASSKLRIEFRYDKDLSDSISDYPGKAYNNAFIISTGFSLK